LPGEKPRYSRAICAARACSLGSDPDAIRT
jgi:hypothetical protein